MWLATTSVWTWYTWCEFGTRGWSLQWPATSAGLQPYAFLEASPLTLRTMGISADTSGKNLSHPVTHSYCLTLQNSPPMHILTLLRVWALAHTPSCLFGWLTECSEHIFLFLAASCSYWLTHSLFGTTQQSCANAVAWTDVQLCRILQKSMKLFTTRLKTGMCHICQRIRHGSLPPFYLLLLTLSIC